MINNAAQTIQYPTEYYTPLIQNEQVLLEENKNLKLIANAHPITSSNQLVESSKLLDFESNRFNVYRLGDIIRHMDNHVISDKYLNLHKNTIGYEYAKSTNKKNDYKTLKTICDKRKQNLNDVPKKYLNVSAKKLHNKKGYISKIVLKTTLQKMKYQKH